VRNLTGRLVPVPRLRGTVAPTRPLAVALPELSFELLVLAAGCGGAIAWRWVVPVVCLLVCFGVARSVRATAELKRRRREADERLLLDAWARSPSAMLGWRARELTSPRRRSRLTRRLLRVERQARGEALPRLVPPNECATPDHLDLLRTLRERLEDRARPVTARGMILLERLLIEPESPLHASPACDALTEALAALNSTPKTTRSHVTPLPGFQERPPPGPRSERRASRLVPGDTPAAARSSPDGSGPGLPPPASNAPGRDAPTSGSRGATAAFAHRDAAGANSRLSRGGDPTRYTC
jgi:hypothetical protein